MAEFDDLFAEWGNDTAGTPLALTLQPFLGVGQDGDVWGDPVELLGLPRQASRRLVRTSQGDEALSTTTVYAGPDEGGAFTIGSLVTIDGHTGAVLQVKHEQGGDLGDYYEIAVE